MNLPFTDFHIMGVGLNALFDPKESFGHVNAESLSLRGDINILPFWNLFGIIGKVNVDATVDAHYTGALKETPLGLLCLKEPKLCQPGNVHLPLHLEYDVIGAGTTLSVGYKEFFASLTGTYTTTLLKGNENWGDPIITIQPM
ncbi:hypothetical protein QO220_22145, partial [Vibrio vulnificus]|nr:hypothetical protein [Vibrio vulnificus]